MEYSGARRKQIHEKTLSKNSRDTVPLNLLLYNSITLQNDRCKRRASEIFVRRTELLYFTANTCIS